MATIHHLPLSETETDTPGWAAMNARYLLDQGISVAAALARAEDCPPFRPVAVAMEGLEDVADVSRDLIRAASRR